MMMNATYTMGLGPNNSFKIVYRLSATSAENRRKLKMSTFTKNCMNVLAGKKAHRPINNSRFKKHKNIMEENKINLQKMGIASVPHTACTLPMMESRNTIKSGVNYLPKKLADFAGETQKENQLVQSSDKISSGENTNCNSENLQVILLKHNMKKPRNLLGYNILNLQKKYNFSRFQLHTLYSMYHTLLNNSKESLNKFKKQFEVIFNMNKIAIRPEVLEKIFREQKKIDFQNFLDMYRRIDDTIFKQSVIDYVQIVFQGIYNKEEIIFDDIIRIMRNRITEQQSIDIARIIFEQLDRKEHETVSLAQIEDLCHTSDCFAKKMYRLYTSQCKSQ